jgi:hypothetical protein
MVFFDNQQRLLQQQQALQQRALHEHTPGFSAEHTSAAAQAKPARIVPNASGAAKTNEADCTLM